MRNLPTLPVLSQPWANGGERADIPSSSTGTNRASLQDGWNDITSTPIDDGGVPPNRLDFNGLGYLGTVFGYALQMGMFWSYNSSVANAIGGYPKGAILWKKDANGMPEYVVMSMIENNTYDFQSTPSYIDGAKWKKVTINAQGDAMLGMLSDVNVAQIRNIALVSEEPATGVDGVIYAVIEE